MNRPIPRVRGPKPVAFRSRMLAAPASPSPKARRRLVFAMPAGTPALLVGFLLNGATAFAFLLLPRLSHRLGGASLSSVQALWFVVFLLTPGVFGPLEQATNARISACRARGQSDAGVIRAARRTTALLCGAITIVVLALSPLLVRRAFENDRALVVWLALAVVGNGLLFWMEGVVSGRRQFGAYAAMITFEGAVRVAACAVLVVANVRSPSAYGLLIALTPWVTLGFTFFREPALLTDAVARLPHTPEPASASAASWGGPPDRSRSGPQGRSRLMRRDDRDSTSAPEPGFGRAVIHLLGGQLALQVMLNVAPIAATLLATASDKGRLADFGTLFIVSRVPLFLYQGMAIALLAELSALAATGRIAQLRALVGRVCAGLGAIGLVGVGFVAALAGPLGRQVLGSTTRLGRSTWTEVAIANVVGLLALTLSVALLAQGRLARAGLGWAIGAIIAVIVIAATPGANSLVDRVTFGYLVGMLAAAGALATFTLQPAPPAATPRG